MSIIKKLILREWLTFFTGSVFILLMVLSLGHMLSGLLSARMELQHLMKDLILEWPTFLIKIFPVSCLIASLFSINKLKSRNELTAIFASGYGRSRFVVSICTAGSIAGIILFYINAYLVPYAKHQQTLLNNPEKANSISINALNSGKIWFKGKDYFFSYSSFNTRLLELHNLTLYYYDNDFKFSEQISAPKAVFKDSNNWILTHALRATNLQNKTFPDLKNYSTYPIVLNESVSDFKKINTDILTLSIWKLYDYISVLRASEINPDEYYVIFLDKFSSAVTCLVLAVLASVALFNPNRRNSSFGKSVSMVLSFTFFYWFVYSYFLTLGQTSHLPPILATFGVPMLFVIYLFFYFIYHRKLR
jgi:lipopolysaccharide export system permease protein